MITEELIKKYRIGACYEIVQGALQDCLDTIDIVMNILEMSMNENELANDKQYQVLCSMYHSINDVLINNKITKE